MKAEAKPGYARPRVPARPVHFEYVTDDERDDSRSSRKDESSPSESWDRFKPVDFVVTLRKTVQKQRTKIAELEARLDGRGPAAPDHGRKSR